MQFDKLTEIYRTDMNEQIEINKKFRRLNEVQRKVYIYFISNL